MLILGLPSETIWGKQDALGRTTILSGFDILSAIIDFHHDRFPLRNLEVLKHLNGLHRGDLDFAERKHFEQIDISLDIVLYDSDPLLKCLFKENINRNVYGENAAQLARKIIFKKKPLILWMRCCIISLRA